MNFKKNISLMILGIILGAGLAALGTMGYNDAQAEQAHYCSMIGQGNWPAYKGVKGCPSGPTTHSPTAFDKLQF